MFQPMQDNRLTDGEICSDLQYFYEVSIDFLVVYKGLFENQSTKRLILLRIQKIGLFNRI